MNKNTILKGLLPLAVFPLLFWGCSDDKFGSDSSSGKQISFRLQGNLPSSRATGTTVENINAFVVNAQTDWSEDPVLFSSQTVARLEGQANAFDYSPKRYYPDEAAFAYYSAYSPVTGNVDGFGGKTGSEINTIAYFVPAPDIDGNTTQEDLLVAYTPVKGVAQTPGAAPVHRDGFESPVQLTFKHALSRVFVRTSNNNTEPVVIKKLILHNLYSQGTLKIDDKINAPAEDKVLWKFDGYTQSESYAYVLLPTGVSVPAKTEKEESVYVVGKDQGMLVLPQTTKNADGDAVPNSATDFFVEVTYSISNIQEKTVQAAFRDLYGKAGGLTFEMGRQYALTLAFTDAAVEFDISVEGWEESETDAYAATTVVFNDNRPSGVSDTDFTPCGIANNSYSKFIHGQSIATTTNDGDEDESEGDVIGKAAPILDGYIFQGYFDSREGGTQYFVADADGHLIVSVANKSFDGTKWDKAGPSCTLYAQWEEATNVWGASNIYFRPDIANGVVGSLTFAKSDQTKSGYQGLYFKWGSLIGVAAGGTGDGFDANTFLYIPDLTTGKYYKVKAGLVLESYGEGTADMNTAVQAYALIYPSVSNWVDDIPYVKGNSESDPEQIAPLSGSPTDAERRADRRLTDKSAGLYEKYMGDICKFLTDKKDSNGSGLTKKWVIPTSDVWKGGSVAMGAYGSGAMYKKTKSDWSSTAVDFTPPNAVDGTGKNPTALMTYTLDTGETVIFPAAGTRYDGQLYSVGGSCYYWSSSVYGASGAYSLGFDYGSVSPEGYGSRSHGFPVRCVQEFFSEP
jgi:hypothetical protein